MVSAAIALLAAATAITGSNAATKHIMDNDWILELNYPFPMDICINTQPRIVFPPLADIKAGFTKYVCSDDGQSVTKYQWSGLESVNYDCSDMDAANVTVLEKDDTLTQCDPGFFICDGEVNYVKSTIFGGFTEGSCEGALLEFDAFVATDVCFCDSSETALQNSGMITCDSSSSAVTNYTDQMCSAGKLSPMDPLSLGNFGECAFFYTVEQSAEFPITLQVNAQMNACFVNSEPLNPTPIPTPQPTGAPSTPSAPPTQAPSHAPTTPSASPTSAPSAAPTAPSAAPTTAKPTEAAADPNSQSSSLKIIQSLVFVFVALFYV